MDVSKKLFGISKKMAKSIFKPYKKTKKTKATMKSNPRYDENDPVEVFEKKYAAKCERWEDRIYDAATYSCLNPDDNIKEFEKQMKLYEEFKTFCEETPGGQEYFDFNCDHILSDIQEEYDRYMSEQYEQDKEYYKNHLVELEKAEKPINELSEKILILLREAGGSAKQRNIIKNFSESEKKLKDKAVAKLVDSKQIKRESDGHNVTLTIK